MESADVREVITQVLRIIFVLNDEFEFISPYSVQQQCFITLCITIELKLHFLANHRKQIEAPAPDQPWSIFTSKF